MICGTIQVLAASAGTVWAGVCRGGKLGPGLGGDSLLYGGPGHLLPNTAPDWGPSVGSGDTLDIRLGLEDRAVNQPFAKYIIFTMKNLLSKTLCQTGV